MRRVVTILSLLACLLAPAPAGADTPVFVFIMDEFSGTSLEGRDGKIDQRRFPNLASLARTATWYPMATTGSDMTFRAVPSIWSGLSLDRAGEADRTLYRLLENDYRLVQFEDMGPVQKLCTSCPPPPPGVSQLDGVPIKGRDSQASSIRSTLGAIKAISRDDEKPMLWTSHVVLPHAPYRFLPSGDQVPLSPFMQNPGVTEAKRWGSERWPLTLSRQRFLLQAGYTDRIIGRLRSQMERAGVWQKAMVVLVADHGSSWTPGTHRRYIEDASFAQVANVPLLIKYPDQSEPRIDKGSAQLIDIAPTIASVLGRSLDWGSPGLSLLSRRPKRDISVFTAERREWVTRSFRTFTRSRRSSVKSWNRLFPRGAEGAWIGPARSLKGRSVRAYRSNRASASAQIELKAYFKKVRPGSGWLPAVLGAEIFSLPPGSPLAASVNGRMVASGYSYRDSGGSVRANIPLPPSSLKKGRNRVELWSLGSGVQLLDSTGR